MTWVLDSSGTTAALTIGTETTLATSTQNATFVGQVDTSNLVNGDVLEIRVYTINLSGGSLTQTWKGTYQNIQIDNEKVTPFVASDQSFRITLNQTAGTGRTFAWKILRQ
jgi:hypothetical protein